MIVALYARVSTKGKDQDPEVQLLALRRYCDYKGWTVYAEYRDECSGKSPIRKGLKRLLKDAGVEEGTPPKFDAILFLRVDRIMRNLAHFLNLCDVLDAKGVRMISASDGLDYSTPIGAMVRNILASVAQFEGELLVERTKEGLEKAREEGKILGRPEVKVDLEKAIGLLEQGISKAKVARMLCTNPATLNNRLRAAGRLDLVGNPTQSSKTKGSG